MGLALGADIEAELQGQRCSVMIFNRTIGVMPVDEGKETEAEKTEKGRAREN